MSWDAGYISGVHRVPIASRARKRGKVAICSNRFGQHPPICSEKIDGLGLRLTYLCRLLLDGTSSIFKTQNTGNPCNWHGEIIEDEEDVGGGINNVNQ
jgi:hypothetical protein